MTFYLYNFLSFSDKLKLNYLTLSFLTILRSKTEAESQKIEVKDRSCLTCSEYNSWEDCISAFLYVKDLTQNQDCYPSASRARSEKFYAQWRYMSHFFKLGGIWRYIYIIFFIFYFINLLWVVKKQGWPQGGVRGGHDPP